MFYFIQLIVVASLVVALSSPATADPRDTCRSASGAEAIAACGAVIGSRKTNSTDRAAAYNNRGVEYQNKGELPRAIADYDQAIRFDPNLALAFKNRGIAYNARGELDLAIRDYEQAISLDPKSTSAFYNRAVAYQAKGDLDRALADYD